MPTPVSSTSISTRLRERGAARDAQRAALGHRLAGVEREVEQRLPQHPGVRVDRRQVRPGTRASRSRCRRSASGVTEVTMSLMTAGELDGLQLELVGTRELEEAVQHLVETLDFARDDVDVVDRRRRREAWTADARIGPAPSAPTGCDTRDSLLFNSSRWIVIALSGFFTSCATPAIRRPERGELARVVERRVHLRHVAQVARDEHRADELALPAVDRMGHQEPLVALSPSASPRPAGAVRREPLASREPGPAAGATRACGRPAREPSRWSRTRAARCSSPGCRTSACRPGPKSATASSRLSTTDSKSVGEREGLGARLGELRADGVERAARDP